ncbi:hypothetical protein ACPA9J_19950 [Pseudomonas aeruginosa]
MFSVRELPAARARRAADALRCQHRRSGAGCGPLFFGLSGTGKDRNP